MMIEPGTEIGRYHILEQLGQGGMALVYKAYDVRLENEVAIKFIRTDDITPNALARVLKRFEVEAKKTASLQHPNIVRVMDYGEFKDTPYLVQEYIKGGTLKGRLGRPMPYQEALALLLPIARALAYAHSKGLVHRDVKPSNILISESGEPMLTDFGIAKVISSEETLDLTVTGMGVGTPEYMAPEQAEGKAIDARADIYALGVVLYELLTGRKPFEADTPMAVLIKHARDPLPQPSKIIEGITPQVDQMLFKALAKQPIERYQDMVQMMTAMQDELRGAQAPPGTQPQSKVLKEEATSVVSAPQAQKKKEGEGSTPMWLAIGLVAAAFGIIMAVSRWGSTPAAEIPSEEGPAVKEAAREPISACLVTDYTGIGDRSFNDMAWKGLQQAEADFGVEINYIESMSAYDYDSNLQACIDSEAEMIVCVGFMMADACARAIKANPDRYFVGVDINFLDFPNLVGVDAYMDHSCFQAGYLAAGMTQTDIVATYTGFFGPLTQIFMDSFYMGVKEYNKVHGTEVDVLGYDPANMKISATTGSWSDVDACRQLTETFMDNSADIVLPVVGNVGIGSAAVMEERGFGYIIGVDQDWTQTNPQYNAQILASVTKNMDICVYNVAKGLTKGQFTPGNCILTLENGGTELVFNEGIEVHEDLKAEVEALSPKIISGEIQTLSSEFLETYRR